MKGKLAVTRMPHAAVLTVKAEAPMVSPYACVAA